MPYGTAQLVLKTSQPNVKSFLRNVLIDTVQQALAKLTEKANFKWGFVFVGPKATREQIWAENEKRNAKIRNVNCLKLSPVYTDLDGYEYGIPSPNSGRAIYENTDAEMVDVDTAQSVYLIPPSSIGTNQSTASAFLNNVKTDSGYILQNGFAFRFGGGEVVYTNTNLGYQATGYPNNIIFDSSHTYWFVITYTAGTWYQCVEDSTTSDYSCEPDTSATGSSLALDVHTGIWLENFNTNSNWYQGFSDPWEAYGAEIFVNGIGQPWDSEHRHTVHACVASYPPQYAMPTPATMVGGGYGNFVLDSVPLEC